MTDYFTLDHSFEEVDSIRLKNLTDLALAAQNEIHTATYIYQ